MCFGFQSNPSPLPWAYICHLYLPHLHPQGYITQHLSRRFICRPPLLNLHPGLHTPVVAPRPPFCTTLPYTILIFLSSTHWVTYPFYRHWSIPITSYCTIPSLHWWPIFCRWSAVCTIPSYRSYSCPTAYGWCWFRCRTWPSSTGPPDDWTCRSRVIFKFNYSHFLYYVILSFSDNFPWIVGLFHLELLHSLS